MAVFTKNLSCKIQLQNYANYLREMPGRALMEKGMKIRYTTDMAKFTEEIKKPEISEAWFISHNSSPTPTVMIFHYQCYV